jgi:uncharacterized protein (UPF0332 family)
VESWRDLAAQNRSAAHELLARRRWRACVNRAYYAVYAETTAALADARLAMPAGREGPHHIPLPQVVGYNLMSLANTDRWRLADLIGRLYAMRCLADYRPSVSVEQDEARISLGLMRRALSLLEKIT